MSNGVYVAMIELQALNYVFSKNSLRLFVHNGITEEHFTTYKNHYNFVVSFFNEYNQLPSRETFQSKFEGEWEWITVSDPEEYLIEKLKEAKLYRDVIVEYKKIGELIKDEKTDKAIEKMASISQQFMRLQNSNCVRLIEDVQMRVDGYLERVNNPDKAFVSTGLMELDEILGGWDLLNESATICASTGIGKSWMLVYFAMNAAKAGLIVGYYSCEMESDLVGYSLITLFAKYSKRFFNSWKSKYKRTIFKLCGKFKGVYKG